MLLPPWRRHGPSIRRSPPGASDWTTVQAPRMVCFLSIRSAKQTGGKLFPHQEENFAFFGSLCLPRYLSAGIYLQYSMRPHQTTSSVQPSSRVDVEWLEPFSLSRNVPGPKDLSPSQSTPSIT